MGKSRFSLICVFQLFASLLVHFGMQQSQSFVVIVKSNHRMYQLLLYLTWIVKYKWKRETLRLLTGILFVLRKDLVCRCKWILEFISSCYRFIFALHCLSTLKATPISKMMDRITYLMHLKCNSLLSNHI